MNKYIEKLGELSTHGGEISPATFRSVVCDYAAQSVRLAVGSSRTVGASQWRTLRRTARCAGSLMTRADPWASFHYSRANENWVFLTTNPHEGDDIWGIGHTPAAAVLHAAEQIAEKERK